MNMNIFNDTPHGFLVAHCEPNGLLFKNNDHSYSLFTNVNSRPAKSLFRE